MQIKQVWMSPDTRDRRPYGLRLLGGMLGIAGLIVLIILGGTAISFYLGLPQKIDVYKRQDVKFALEVHPTEIAFDYYSTAKLLEVFDRRPTLGLNFDPSHLVWQGVNPCVFLRDFADRIYHVHMKDVKVTLRCV